MKCLCCDDKGTLQGCPYCGKKFVKQTIVPDFEVTDEMLSLIPQQYRDVWDSSKLRSQFPDLENNKFFCGYVDKLDKLVETFQKGLLPQRSTIIMSSVGLGKTRVAYYCMALANQHGYTVGPLIDNTEYRRLNNLSTDNQLYKEFLKYNKHLPTIETIVQSDVQFLTIDPCNFKDSYIDIMSLLSKRDRLGKPTIILSQYNVNQITYSDYSSSFSKLVSNTGISETKSLRKLEFFLGG